MKASIPVPSALRSRTLPPAGVLPTGHFEDRRPEHARQAQLKSVIQAVSSPGTGGMNSCRSLPSPAAGLVIQRESLFDMQGGSLPERLDKQFRAQQMVKDEYGDFADTPFTSVGFEYEFAEFKFNGQPDHPLRDVTHLEIARSQPPAPFANLPFSVETDADNAIELVTPPFLIQTVGRHPIPDPDVITDFNELMKRELGALAEKGYEAPAPAKTKSRPPQ